MPANTPLTLSQFQYYVGNALRAVPQLQRCWIVAELSDLAVKGGHCYMELLEKDARGTTVAKARAMIWAREFPYLRRKFYDATGRDLSSGIKVMVCGSATYHSVFGFSITISDIDPSYTVGDMERLRREILMRLHNEGVIGFNRSLPLSITPQRIAIISAEGAAGYGDFMNELLSAPEQFAVYPMLFPAVMQGERTAPSVLHALDLIEGTADMWDCVVIIRGGGATTDLNGFDNYDLARRVATFGIPVYVGIGHERDRTVLDEVAAVRCKTPTAVAAYINDTLRNTLALTTQLVDRAARYCSDAIHGEKRRLDSIETSLPSRASNCLLKARMNLNNLCQRVAKDAAAKVAGERTTISRLALRSENGAKTVVSNARLRLQRLDDMSRLLSPDNTLRRGYSITRVNGKAVRDASLLHPGDTITTTLANGTLTSKIEN